MYMYMYLLEDKEEFVVFFSEKTFFLVNFYSTCG